MRRGLRVVTGGALAAGLFLGSWQLIHYGPYRGLQIEDTPLYERYGDAIDAGRVPYRDFPVEYPPAALPMFSLPSLRAAPGDLAAYRGGFEALMAACGAAAAALVAGVLVARGASTSTIALAIALTTAFPLALGSVVLSRFDLWPAFLTTAALAAAVFGRWRLASLVLAVAVAAKLYPLVLLPPLLLLSWHRATPRRALECAGVFAGGLLLCFLPFFVLSPGGVWGSVTRQLTRPLQIESLGASLLLAAHHVAGFDIEMRSSRGSQNLVGTAPDVLSWLQSVLLAGVLLALWVAFARGPLTDGRLLQVSASSVCAFVALGKVLSPQFLVWLVPLVALVGGRRGLVAAPLLVLALVLTQLWFPDRYLDLALRFDPLPSWLLLARNVTLLLVLLSLVVTLRGAADRPRSRPRALD